MSQIWYLLENQGDNYLNRRKGLRLVTERASFSFFLLRYLNEHLFDTTKILIS